MITASRFRSLVIIFAATLLFMVGTAPILAQDAKSPNTDLRFHKFVPVTAPENNASAKAALQASTPDDKNTAAMQQMQLLLQEKATRTPAQQKIDSNVLYTIRMMRGQEAVPGVTSLYTGVDLDQDNRIVVDIVADVTPELLQQLDSVGALVLSSHPEYRAIQAIVPPNQIETIAASPDVSFIARKAQSLTSRVAPRFASSPTAVKSPAFEARAANVRKQIAAFLQQRSVGTNGTTGVINTGQGIVTTEGDATHLAARSRGIYGVNGSGLKIGVLSDSANATGALIAAQATGDMPPTCPGPGGPCITVVQDFLNNGGSDEGTAMMEIIYDMAPGASLFFATADVSESQFAANIQNLRNAGCDIIVDDVFYFDEPVFQDGIVAQAVNSVTASGALYFSSAGNEGNKDAGTSGYFEGDFSDVGSPAFVFPGGAKAGTIHNFGGGLLGDPITAPGEGYVLQWADPFKTSANDYDLFYVNSAGVILASSTNVQSGGPFQNPFEEIDPPVSGNLGDKLVVFKTTSAVPLLFALKTIRGTLTVATAGETWGHSAATAAFSVAAAPAAANFGAGFPSGPFPNAFNRGSALEPFTSDGPRRIIFNPDGTPITPGNFSSTGGTVRNKPDITAADGVSTTLPFASGLNPFFGTSAAAPHAAAIAALVKSAVPTLTPDQIRTTLTTTALDLAPLGFDRDSGNGIVMADAAMDSLGLQGFANLTISSAIANENPGNGNGILEPGEGGSLAIQLDNGTGVKNATGITAVLSTTTPGVMITQPATSVYPDIPLNFGGVNNLTPFTFTIASNAPCALKINFVLTLTFSGGPAPTKELNFSIQTGVFPITGNLGSSAHGLPPGVTFATGSQTDRLFRSGVASTCASTKFFPGTVAVGPRTFDSFTFTASQALCFQSVLTSVGGASLFTSAYSPSFVPSTISSNFAGDAGASGSPQVFSINASAANTYTVVVTDSSPSGNAVGIPYTLLFPSCAITNPANINHPPIALAHDVTVTAATTGGTVAVSIDNGSSDPDVGDTITKTQTPPGPYAVGTTSVLLTVVDSKGATAQATANVTVLNPGPDLLITKTHTGNFLPGQVGASYTINVTSVGNAATSGTVTVVDTLPSGLTATAIGGTGWTCTLATLTCSRADSLATGTSYPSITLTVNVAAFPPASVTNTATASGGGDVNPNNNIATDHTTIVVNPDLTVAVSHLGNFTQGQSNAVYTIVVTNVGTAPTNALVEFLDTLPAGFSIISFGPGSGWSCSLSGGLETCERPDPLAPNSSYPPLLLNVRIATNAAASVTNVVNVFGGGELNTTNDTASDPTTVTPAPNLTITGTHTGNFSQGQPGNYALTVSNIGFASTTGSVTVADTIPTGFSATAMSGTGWTCTVATATCTRADALAPSASFPAITLTGNVAANAPTSFSNSVNVSGGGEVFLADDTSVDPTTINQLVDMTISSSHTGIFFPGEIGATYTLVATNIGISSTTAAVTVQDNLPGMTATAMSGAGWTCNVAAVNCTRSDVLAANSSYPPITLTVNVQEPAPGQLLTNIAIVSGGGETNTQNDTANDVTQINVTQDLTIAASHTGNFIAGQTGATYSIVISNGGFNPTTNGSSVSVVDTLPAGLTSTAISGTGWQCTLASLSCTRSDILVGGASYPAITVTLNVSAGASGILTNMAVVSGGGETNTANDTATDPTTIVGPPDLTITKTHVGDFTQGQSGLNGATYTITVSNSGTQPTTLGSNVIVVDALPPSLTATGILGTGWTCTLATLTCVEHDPLAPGASYPPITLSVLVGSNAPASVTNMATVSGGGELNTANDVASDQTTIVQLADMIVTKSHTGSFALGQVGATYSIVATNTGRGATTGAVTVVDSLPAGLTATAMSGAGWACTIGTLTCTRNDVLGASASYSPITLTVNVTGTTAGNVTNTVTVSGGGEIIVSNDSASDVTALIQDFSESGPGAPDVITAGQTANFTITVTPGAGGFANAVSFSASGLPSASSPLFNPASLTPGSAATSTTFSIATTARGAVPPSGRPRPWAPRQLIIWMLALASIVGALLTIRVGRRKRYVPATITAAVFLLAMIITGCGSAGGPPPPTGTPAGTYPITVTATSGALSHSTTVTLTVQ